MSDDVKLTVHHLGRRPCGLVVFWEADEANYTEVNALLRDGVRIAAAPSKLAKGASNGDAPKHMRPAKGKVKR